MAVPTLTANSPVAGSISWSAFSIQYAGVSYGVGASSTALKYVYWIYNGGTPTLQASNTLPNLTADDILLFVNKAGVPVNVPASSVVDGSLIVDGSIVGSALIAGTVHGDRIQAGTLTVGQIDNLQATLDAKATEAYVQSRGTDLVTNGTGLLGDNTNFSWATFNPADAPVGVSGSFKTTKGGQTRTNDEYIPVDPAKAYVLSVWARETTTEVDSCAYTGFSPYDAYQLSISPQHYMYRVGTTTTLAVDLNPGDTTITLTSSANWNNAAGTNSHYRNIIFWDYVDAGGKAWPAETYSRNFMNDAYADGGISSNVITLKAPYSGPARPAGTKLSNGSSGGTYMYSALANNQLTNSWTNYKSANPITGLHTMGTTVGANPPSASTAWPQGTAFAKLVFLANRTAAAPSNNPNAQQAFAGISLSDAAGAQRTANDVKALTDGWRMTGQTTINGGQIAADTILGSMIVGKTISASKLMISSLENMISDPTFMVSSLSTALAWSPGTGISISATGLARNGGRVLLFANNATQQASYNHPTETPCEAGDVFSVSMSVKPVGTTLPINGARLGLRWKLANGTFDYSSSIVNAATVADGTWVRLQGRLTAPANATSVSVYVSSEAVNNTGSLHVDYVSMVRAASGELIVDGSIVADKIASGAIIADKIGANQIVAGKIAVDAVTSGTIAADAITAKHTITGATIQTHPSANTGLKIVGNVLTSYDGSGVARFIANGNDGTVTVVGGSITGGTFKTATTGKRTEINTDSADSSRVLFYSGLAEEYTPSSITSTSTKTDANNIQTGVTLQAGTVTGSTGSASIVIGAGKGMTGALPATRVQINAYNDSVNPAIVSIGAGPSGLEISDPAGAGNDFAKLTGTEVLIESVTKPFKVYAGGTIAAPGTKVSTFEINGDLSIPGRLISALDDTGWRVVGDPGQPGFTGNWVNFGSGHVPARFKKVGGIVYVQGLIRLGMFGSTAFQLPVGYRPSHTIMNTQIEGTNAAGRMDITSLGQIVPTSGNSSFFSVTFAFPADQ